MLDVVSAVATLLTLIQVTSQVVDYLSDLKDGGKERMKLLAEVSTFCCALDNLKELLENDLSTSGTDDTSDERWTKGLHLLLLRDGILEQCNGVVSSLEKRLAPKEGRARVIQHLRWPFSKADTLQAVEQLHRLQTTINHLLGQMNISLSQQIRHDGAVSREILEDHKAQEIRSWLSPLDFAAQQEMTFASHCPGTAARFLQSEEFKVWKSQDKSSMWCRGHPGAGKTYLSSIVVNHLQQDSKTSNYIVLVVYCRYDDPQCQNITNIAGDLLRQCILQRRMPEALAKLFRKHHSSTGSGPTYDAFFSILSEQLESYQRVYIIVDALDEIALADDRRLLLETLRSIIINSSLMVMSRNFEDIRSNMGLINYECDCCAFEKCIHCEECARRAQYLFHCGKCIHPKTSWVNAPITFDLCQRCYDAGVRCLGEGHTLELLPNCVLYDVAPDEEDLECYLRWRMASNSSLKMLVGKGKGLQEEVAGAVVSSSASMFLMAKLIIDGLATCLTIKELKAALADIPSGLAVAYNATMQRITDQGKSRSQRAFEVMKWVLLAKRPLTSAEIEHTVSIEHGSEDIDLDDIVPATVLASLCAGLVVIDGYGNFRFMHQTVPEYLSSYHSEKFLDAEAALADKCLTYIQYKAFKEGPCRDTGVLQARHLRYPAYTYCTRHWYQHLNGTPKEEQKRIALEFFQNESYWRSAIEEAAAAPESIFAIRGWDNVTVLHYAAVLDADLLVDNLMDLDPTSLNWQDSGGWSPLMVAACYGSLHIASKLLNAGANVDLLTDYGHNALHLAVLKDRGDLVDLLIANPHADINSLTANNSVTAKENLNLGGDTALILAARTGRTGIVNKLLKQGAEVKTMDACGTSALHLAAWLSHSHVVNLLIASPKIDINLRSRATKYDIGGESALIKAARQGNVEIVLSLIRAGADLNIANDKGDTALHVAVEAGHVAVVEALVDNGMDVDLLREIVSVRRRLLAVMEASMNGDVDMLDIILKHSRDVNFRSADGETTALLCATLSGAVDAVKLLLSQKTIEVDLADDDGWTPLICAANYESTSIIPHLVSHGADLNQLDRCGRTPIMITVQANYTETAKALLSFPGVDVNTTSCYEDRAPLHYAVSWGNAELVELLIAYGADLHIRDDVNYFTPLDYARYFNDRSIIDLLKANDPESRFPSG